MQTLTIGVLDRSNTRMVSACNLLPGLFLTTTIAAAAYEVRNLPGVAALGPLIVAIASCSVCSRH
jgi:hypothetical protein